ncbi:hypothetical protein FTX61_19850 [Nitriliruptoraceae bacterium ZYF776]|nr:hypothetical protein [Profundirhabdus halotolerans]
MLVVLGDVVASRRFEDESALLAGLSRALAGVNDHVTGVRPLALHVRDEFAAVYPDLGTAATAALRLRLATDDLVLRTDEGVDEPVELRLGLGFGDTVGDDHASGAAWELARAARAAAEELAGRRTWPGSVRSRCRSDDRLLEATVNAHLLLQDQLLARMDARDRRALRGLLDGERQVDVAAALGVTQPAIARRLRDRGALAVHRALEDLRAAT